MVLPLRTSLCGGLLQGAQTSGTCPASSGAFQYRQTCQQGRRRACSGSLLRRPTLVQASPEDPPPPQKEDEEGLDSLRSKYFSSSNSDNTEQGRPLSGLNRNRRQKRSAQVPNGQPTPPSPASAPLEKVNPYSLGRKARAAFDDLWSQVSALTSPTKRTSSFFDDDVLDSASEPSFEAPEAAYTTVLVVGATGRVGRILTRKLLLRGYTVKALVRKRQGKGVELPAAVEILEGDVGNPSDCLAAVRDVNKVIFCAAARSAFTADLLRVEDRGVMNIAKAFQDEFQRTAAKSKSKVWPQAKLEIADFSMPYHQQRWDITYVGSPDQERMGKIRAQDRAVAEINEDNNLVFEGVLFQRGAIAEVGAQISPLLPKGGHRTEGTEGLVMRIKGDDHVYMLVLATKDGSLYGARFPARVGYATLRVPFTAFRPATASQPPLDPVNITSIAIRYDKRRSALAPARASTTKSEEETENRDQKFRLEVDYIKALPGGSEPDVVLVSCAGQERAGLQAEQLRKVVEFKRRGEENLRQSGLGYAIIRPGTLVEEPGGYKALVFDQTDRVAQSISAADVADICLRALHEPEARNKTFDVCYEYTDTDKADDQLYELVARMPDKSNNYLKSAVASLAKNT